MFFIPYEFMTHCVIDLYSILPTLHVSYLFSSKLSSHSQAMIRHFHDHFDDHHYPGIVNPCSVCQLYT